MTVETIDLSVGGMTCAGCASNIQRGLTLLPGVEGAEVNVATRRATVRPDGTIDPGELEDAMRAAITGLGYQVLTGARTASPADAHAEGAHGSHHAESTHGAGGADLHSEHEAHMRADAATVRDYRRRFTVAALLAAPLLLVSMIPALRFEGWGWLALALATPVAFYSGWPFHRSALMSARHRATTMDTLVSLGSMAAWLWSTVVLVGGAFGIGALSDGHLYFETGAVIIALIVLGKWLEVRSTASAGDAIRALSARQSATARLEDGTEIAREQLQVGMRFVVRPGETIATDGVVVDGGAAVDTSLVTGEPVPVRAEPGADVVGGTIATDGALTVEASRVGSETMLAQIARMVDQAQSGKARVQRLADRISAVFVPVVIALSAATLLVWLLMTGDVDRAFTAAVAVLIISCPCALGLATPLAIMVGTGRGAQLGVLVRGPQALEDTRDLNVVVLDKTGTVTEGRMTLVDARAPGLTRVEADRLLDAAATVESRSEHPIAVAIAAARPGRMPLKNFRSMPGQGAAATVQGASAGGDDVDVLVGSRRLFDELPEELERLAATAESQGCTAVFVGRTPAAAAASGIGASSLAVRTHTVAEAVLTVADAIKPTSREAIDAFGELGLEVVLLTGDNELVARAVAAQVGIERVHSQVLPGDKASVIRELQEGGTRVAMVGDGVNDSPALAQADLGIAIGTGADVAREASDLTVVSGDLRGAADAIALSRKTIGTIRGNLAWAFAYNVAAIPLAALGVLNPMIAAGAMGASSLFVVANSLRLRGFAGYRRR